ncbi:hypothetical protein C2845_PM13G12090 [Panicum miliaceum]|uniref:Uncharacterized protein n=1 Tax=Panicum miliaceum TaxID=4540 RepID=A0A3L6RFQ5_PANMI|nr:hypothetical protein C2845_PM13G12090 [Panicum miliaceum]
MKDMARLSWQAAYENRVGGSQQIVQVIESNMDRMLQSFPRNKPRRSGFDQFIRIVGTVARIIIAVIFGNPMPMIAAVAGPGGLLQ